MIIPLSNVGQIRESSWLFVFAISASLFTIDTEAQCRDYDAIDAANKKAASYFKNGEVFHPGAVQKVHNTSGRKEIASYIKTGSKRYSIFTLVDADCNVKFRKRTRQSD